ncbi:hypothetical protein [Rhizobium mayense]
MTLIGKLKSMVDIGTRVACPIVAVFALAVIDSISSQIATTVALHTFHG